ncbi:MAG: phosphoglycerate kinase, partial [Pseudomonadota bacterium]
KVSSKIELLLNLITKADMLVVGGGMANTFIYAQGHRVGKSLCEPTLADTAREILAQASAAKCEIILPVDAVVAAEFKAGAPSRTIAIDAVGADDMILDLGPDSVDLIAGKMAGAQTLVWNGPLGAFEMPPFDTATVEAARYAARLVGTGTLTAVAGGGDTVAALNHANVAGDFTYMSTAGGAFLEWLEGKTLPGVKALEG